jgi:hypothetical protein
LVRELVVLFVGVPGLVPFVWTVYACLSAFHFGLTSTVEFCDRIAYTVNIFTFA